MRILILANNDVGLYKFRKELIQELIKQGNEIYISLPYGDLVEKLKDMGCGFIDTNIVRRGTNAINDLKLLKSYHRIVKKIRPDIVITYTIKPNIYGGMLCRNYKIPYITNITGLGTAFQKKSFLKRIIVHLYRIALNKSEVVFFENSGNKQVFLQNDIVRDEQTQVLDGAGVNLTEYPFCEYLPDKEIRFLFIGRVMKEKGVDEFFTAAQSIKSKYKNVYFDVVGPMEDDYQDIINDLEEKQIINYYGYQEDVKSFIKKCHCLVLPSYHEGMANTLLEAAAMGRPLITSKIHGCMEAVEEGVNGLFCEPENVAELIQAIDKFINIKYLDKKEMGKASRMLVERNFDRKKIVGTTIKFLCSHNIS